MYFRLLFLALGLPTSDSLEHYAAVAVRRYLIRLLLTISCTLVLLIAMGFLVFSFDQNVFVVYLCLSFVLFIVPGIVSICTPVHQEVHEVGGGIFDAELTNHAKKIVVDNKLRPICVFRFSSSVMEAFMVRGRARRIFVSDGLMEKQTSSGIKGIIAHELAHRELPLGGTFANFSKAFIHTWTDNMLELFNDVARKSSDEFAGEIQKVEQGEVVKRSMRLFMLHFVCCILWHTSSFPVSQLQEYACDAIAALMLREPHSLGGGLSLLGMNHLMPYRYAAITHPSVRARIAVLREMAD